MHAFFSPSFARGWLAVSVCAAAAACGNKTPATTAQAKPVAAPVAVPLTTVATQAAPDVIAVTGLVAADQRADVSADTNGRVVAVRVERGQRVKQGEALVMLDTRSAALGATEARANLAAVRAQRALAEEECKRSEQLLAKGAITQSQFDRERTNCTAALQQVAAAEARTQMIAKSVADGVVRAPFDGLITQKMAVPGMWAGPGIPLVTLVDDDPLRLDLAVPEGLFAQIKEGLEVNVEATAFAGQSWKATISRMGGEVGRQNRSITVEARLAPGSPLLPGMFAEAKIVVGQKQLPVVPKTAVVKKGKNWRAFVAVGGQLEERVVQISAAHEAGAVAIRSGLASGEKVATTVTPQIVDGLRIQ